MGHEVVRLPPYHCQYNPIELIWAQVKGKVAKNNTTFKFDDFEKLLNDALDSVTVDIGKNVPITAITCCVFDGVGKSQLSISKLSKDVTF